MSLKGDILDAIKARVELVTIANSYTRDIVTVTADQIRANISDYKDYELPAVQIYDLAQVYKMEQSRSQTRWAIAVELVMRTTTGGVIDQKDLFDTQEDIVRSIMADPKLGIARVLHVTPIDSVTDLHLQAPNYTSTIGLEVLYYEPITRDNC